MEADILAQLRDIHGLDPLPWWHIAPGILIVVAALIGLLVTRHWWWPRRRALTWHKDAEQELRNLRKQLRTKPAQPILVELSALLRRIAIARHGRHTCAGLVGEDWLAWLQAHDPRGFTWQTEGRELIDMRYAPPDTTIDPAQVRRLVDAARYWVQASSPKRTGKKTT